MIPGAPLFAEQTVDYSGHSLLPAPKRIELTGSFTLPENIAIRLIGVSDPRIAGGVEQLINDLTPFIASDKITIETELSNFSQNAWILTLQNHQPSHPFPQPEQNETYHLTVSADEGLLEAQNAYGILLGLQTFRQLITQQDNQANIQVATIDDAPRFTWRGLMLDVARHFQPVSAIKRTLDGMAAVKLNVLHLHLSDDHGFRVESSRFPKLHQLASEGRYYTQDDIHDIVSYAAERGIQVVPEFDMPGHASSFLVAYPQLGSRPRALPASTGARHLRWRPRSNQ